MYESYKNFALTIEISIAFVDDFSDKKGKSISDVEQRNAKNWT